MKLTSSNEVTQLLHAWGNGDKEALHKLMPIVYKELHRLAAAYMRKESPGHTLQTSALVNEAYIKLVNQKNVRWENRAHFFGIAAQLMRRILVDHARSRSRMKRGADAQKLSLNEALVVMAGGAEAFLSLEDALIRLAEIDAKKCRIVEMKMGEVYRARDPRIGRDVAIKILPSHFSQEPDRVRRFEQEARAAGVLNHPNILAIYDAGTENGSPYLVSELLQGELLREKLKGNPLTVRKAIDYSLQIARGLSAAHEKGIVHRDLKPENIFITKEGRAKILDFGLAKLIHVELPAGQLNREEFVHHKTESGVVVGTVIYMSPEQVRGLKVDHRSDIFAFGSVLYEMLCGKRPFHGDSQIEVMHAILKADPPELSKNNTDIPPELERIVLRCLEKDPNHRFQSTNDLAFALEGATSSAAQSVSHQTPRRNASRKALMAAAVLILFTVLLLVYWNRILKTESSLQRSE
ncbi:ECF-type sigma factor [bacterium]|nr:ECF-type sigma factor [bacterium]